MDSIQETKEWLEKTVIGLSLCPFASKVFNENSILFLPTHFTNLESCGTILQKVISELLSSKSNYTTCLIIFETGLETFDLYLDVYYALEESFMNSHLKSDIQFASFHPEYQFEGTQKDDVENYTNRSPYPIIHLLRTDDVTRAIESHPDIESVPIQNIEKINSIMRKGTDDK